MPRTRDQSNILNGGQIIKNKSIYEPALTVTGEWGTAVDGEIRLENCEGAISFANQPRVLDGRLPEPNAKISYNLDPEALGNPLAGDRKNDTLEMMITDLDDHTSVLAMEAVGTIKFNGRHLVQLIGNDTPEINDIEIHKFYVAINGDDDTGDGSQENPWATPHQAMELVEQVKIDNDAIIEINIGEGTYTFNKPIVVSHPDGNRIHFIGAQPNERLSGFPKANWGTTEFNRLNPSIIPSSTLNPFFNSAGTKSPTTSENILTSFRDSDRIENNRKIINSRNVYKTIFNFISNTQYGINGFMAEGGYIGLIDNIAIIGDGKGRSMEDSIEGGRQTASGIVARGHADITRTGPGASVALGANVAIHNFGFAGIQSSYASVSADGFRDIEYSGISITGCLNGMLIGWGSTAWVPGATIQGCYKNGVDLSHSSSGWFPNINISGCAGLGISSSHSSHIDLVDGGSSTGNNYGYGADNGSTLYGAELFAHGNQSIGIFSQRESSVSFNSVSAIGNGDSGIAINVSSTVQQSYEPETYQIGYPTINNNGFRGISVEGNSSIHLGNVYIKDNDYNGVSVSSNSYAYLIPRSDLQEWTEISNNGLKREKSDVFGSPIYYCQILCLHNSTIMCAWNKISQNWRFPPNQDGNGILMPTVWALNGSYIYLSNPNNPSYLLDIDNNYQPAIKADNGSNIYADGLLKDEINSPANNPAEYSPIPNTNGNHNSYIMSTYQF